MSDLPGSITSFEEWREYSEQRQWELYRWRVQELAEARKIAQDRFVENVELGRHLADAREALAAQHPESWAKITKRLTDERDEARALLERAGIASFEGDSDLSAYAAHRPLDRDSAERMSWVFRQLCSDIAAWIISVEATK